MVELYHLQNTGMEYLTDSPSNIFILLCIIIPAYQYDSSYLDVEKSLLILIFP